MNRSLILILSLLAVVYADKVHEIFVGCTNEDVPKHRYSSEHFQWAVNDANLHINSRIHICCALFLYNNGWPDTTSVYDFQNNVELVGSFPFDGFTCEPLASKSHFGPTSLTRPKISDPDMIAALLRAEDYSDNALDFPEAVIFTFGNTFLFEARGKIHRLAMIADVPEEVSKTFKPLNYSKNAILESAAIRGTFFLDFPFPNMIIAATSGGDYSYEFSIEDSAIISSFEAAFEMIESKNSDLAWNIFSAAQSLRISKTEIQAYDFHLLLRYSPVVKVSHSFLFFWDNIIVDIIEEILDSQKLQQKKRQDFPPNLLPQLLLEIEDTVIIYFDVQEVFPVAPADLGVLSTVVAFIIPEILRLKIEEVAWFNFDRIIGAGNIATLETQEWDFQEAHVQDEVFLINEFLPPLI